VKERTNEAGPDPRNRRAGRLDGPSGWFRRRAAGRRLRSGGRRGPTRGSPPRIYTSVDLGAIRHRQRLISVPGAFIEGCFFRETGPSGAAPLHRRAKCRPFRQGPPLTKMFRVGLSVTPSPALPAGGTDDLGWPAEGSSPLDRDTLALRLPFPARPGSAAHPGGGGNAGSVSAARENKGRKERSLVGVRGWPRVRGLHQTAASSGEEQPGGPPGKVLAAYGGGDGGLGHGCPKFRRFALGD